MNTIEKEIIRNLRKVAACQWFTHPPPLNNGLEMTNFNAKFEVLHLFPYVSLHILFKRNRRSKFVKKLFIQKKEERKRFVQTQNFKRRLQNGSMNIHSEPLLPKFCARISYVKRPPKVDLEHGRLIVESFFFGKQLINLIYRHDSRLFGHFTMNFLHLFHEL